MSVNGNQYDLDVHVAEFYSFDKRGYDGQNIEL